MKNKLLKQIQRPYTSPLLSNDNILTNTSSDLLRSSSTKELPTSSQIKSRNKLKQDSLSSHSIAPVVRGNCQVDEHTSIPYIILNSLGSYNNNSFNLIICHDMFDTCERYEIYLRPILLNQLDKQIQILLWNYPGQAYTAYNNQQELNIQYLTNCFMKLLQHTTTSNEFINNKPFYLLGIGLGSSIASYYSSIIYKNNITINIRALVIINGWTYPDNHIINIMNSCINEFKRFPTNRPDLPVYYLFKYLFSNDYISKVTLPLALNIHTAIHNPITLDGRIDICKGIISESNDIRSQLHHIQCPLLYIYSGDNAIVRPMHIDSYIQHYNGSIKESIYYTLKSIKSYYIISYNSGYDMLQEYKRSTQELIEKLLTGFFENDDSLIINASTSLYTNSLAFGSEDKLDNNLEIKLIDQKVTNRVDSKASKRTKSPNKKSNEDIEKEKLMQQITNSVWDPTSSSFLQLSMLNPSNPSTKSTRYISNHILMKEYMTWRLKRNRRRRQILDAAIMKIQKVYRSYCVRCKVKSIWLHKKAMKIQDITRLFLSNKRKEKNNKMKKIQKIVRGFIVRRKLNLLKKMILSSINIQKNIRGYIVRKKDRITRNMSRYIHTIKSFIIKYAYYIKRKRLLASQAESNKGNNELLLLHQLKDETINETKTITLNLKSIESNMKSYKELLDKLVKSNSSLEVKSNIENNLLKLQLDIKTLNNQLDNNKNRLFLLNQSIDKIIKDNIMNSTKNDVNNDDSNENTTAPNLLENESVKLIESTEEMMREGIKSLYNTYQSSLQILRSISSNKQLVDSIESSTNHTQSIVNLLDKVTVESSNSVDTAKTRTVDENITIAIDNKIDIPNNSNTKASSAVTSPSYHSILKKTSSNISTQLSTSVSKSDDKPVDTQKTTLPDSKAVIENSIPSDSKIALHSDTSSDSKIVIQNTIPSDSKIAIHSSTSSDSKIVIQNTIPSDSKIAIQNFIPYDSKIVTKNTAPSDSNIAIQNAFPSDSKIAIQNTTPSDSKIAMQNTFPSDSKIAIQNTTPSDSKIAMQNTFPSDAKIAIQNTTPSDSKIASSDKPTNTLQTPNSIETVARSEVNDTVSREVTNRPSEEFWSVEDVCEWLASMRLSYYEDIFRVAQIDGNLLKDITDIDLTALGVLNPTHRSLIIQTVANIRRSEAYELPKANSKVRFSRPESSKHSESDEYWSINDVCDWLASMRLSIYEDIFRVARIDGNILYGLTDVDLVALGVLDKSHRELILNAIHHFKITDVVLPIVSTTSNVQSNEDERIEYKPTITGLSVIDSPSPNSYSNGDSLSAIGSPSGVSYYTYTDNTSIRSDSSSDLSEASSKSSSKDNLTAVIDIMKESTDSFVPTTQLHITTETYPSSKADSQSPTSSTTFSIKYPNGLMPKSPMPLTFLYEFVWTYNDLKSYIINNEMQELNEALDSIFPEFGHFDKVYVKTAFLFGKGTVYTNIYSRQEFHINKTDKDGNSLLIIAAQVGNILAGKLLYAKGANIDHQNFSGSTALHFARANNHYDFATWLIDVGANDHIRNEFGLSTYEGVFPGKT